MVRYKFYIVLYCVPWFNQQQQRYASCLSKSTIESEINASMSWRVF